MAPGSIGVTIRYQASDLPPPGHTSLRLSKLPCALAHNRGVTDVTAVMVEEFVHLGLAKEPPGCRDEGGSNTKIGDRNHGLHHY